MCADKDQARPSKEGAPSFKGIEKIHFRTPFLLNCVSPLVLKAFYPEDTIPHLVPRLVDAKHEELTGNEIPLDARGTLYANTGCFCLKAAQRCEDNLGKTWSIRLKFKRRHRHLRMGDLLQDLLTAV